MNLDKIIAYNFNFDKRDLILKEVNNTIKVKFALFCANLNFHKIKANKKNLKIIKDNLAFLESIDNYDLLTEKQIKDIRRAANAAADATYIAYHVTNTATYATVNAAYYAAANTATYAAYRAAYAAYHAVNAADDPEAAKLTIMNHLRKLIIDNLSIEDKSNELLIMSL